MDRRTLRDRVTDILDRQAAMENDEDANPARQELDFEKWRLLHRFIREHPFPTRARLPRSEQWRDAANQVRDLGEPETFEWTLQQAEIARNLENGIQDLRPRKSGPCHALLLEYVGNRKRKALAVLHFAKAAEEQGLYAVNSQFHARSEDILGPAKAGDNGSDGGHEGVPWDKSEE